MKPLNYIHPVKILFGSGRLQELGELAVRYGKKAMLVMDPAIKEFQTNALETAMAALQDSGVEVVLFDQVKPNPVLPDVQAGAETARQQQVDVMIGFGGGSAMDTARAIAVASTHEGTAMDYLYFCDTQPTEKTLPIIQIPTTSGTGSHVSCCSVITDPAREFKSALWNQDHLFAKATIVDPMLMLTVPESVSASTGFDVFTHSFESYININASYHTDLLALQSIRLVIEYLPAVVEDGSNLQAREAMAWADTLAGMCIANAGTTLPHGMGQPISGHFPLVSHGQSLAIVYPAFLEYTADAAVEKFATVAQMFNSALRGSELEISILLKDEVASFMDKIGMACYLDDFGITPDDIDPILKHCMEFPDCLVNPKVPDEETVRQLYMQCFKDVSAV
jgi:alcohol dehydrogenase class IV